MEEDKYLEQHYYLNQVNVVDGIPINPNMRSEFDNTNNELRDEKEISDWLGKPYIVTCENEHWEGGTRYDVRCLTFGAWDRSSMQGQFNNLDEALSLAKEKPQLYDESSMICTPIDGSEDSFTISFKKP